MSNELEQSEFKLEKKILGFRNMQEKLEKYIGNGKGEKNCLAIHTL